MNLSQDEEASTYWVWGVTEWFDEYENGGSDAMASRSSPDLTPTEHLL